MHDLPLPMSPETAAHAPVVAGPFDVAPPESHPAAAAWGALLASTGVGLALKEVLSGRYIHANEVLLAWMGRSADEVVGRTESELFDVPTAAALRAADQAALAQGSPMAAEHRISLAGQPREFSVWRACALAAGGSPRWLLSHWTDLSDRRQNEAQLRGALGQIEQLQSANEALQRELADQALRDPGSGLYAKAHFEEQLRREVDLSGREHREFSIVFIEIDSPASTEAPAVAHRGPPKQAVQAVQAALGRLLRGGTRAMDAACRLDERRFAVLLSGVGLATAHARMEGLRRRCESEIVVSEGRETRFTVAMGVASFPHTAQTQAELVQACSAALCEAQRRGGNQVALAAIRLEAA
jgi:diguanylate cyclase (GGDEF)-like protein